MKLKRLLCIMLSLITLGTIGFTSACGTSQNIGDDTIIVKVFNGGSGVEWIEKVRDEFNAKNEKYQVLLRYDKTLPTGIANEIKQGYPTADCYFSAGNEFQESIYKNYLEDLSDVLLMEVDGVGNGTIGDKMLNKEEWLAAASKNGQGCYMLPYADSIFGLVYNHNLFVENGWLTFADASEKDAVLEDGLTVSVEGNKLKFVSASEFVFYNEGDYILTAGKDGKYGTYDDGQPETEKQFNDMVKKIVNGNDSAKAFLYNGIYDHYTNNIAEAVAAQYMGLDAYKAMYSYDSKGVAIEMYNGQSKAITLENGYEVFNSMGMYKGLKFLHDNFNDSAKVDANSFKMTSYSHTDAQNDYALSFKKDSEYPAMLAEGAWWENEASTMFKTIADEGYSAYGFGKQDFRYMTLPVFEGQKGIDGNGNGSVVSVMDCGAIVVPRGVEPGRLAKLKEFIGMTTRTSVMQDFTKSAGIIRPYNYNLSQEDLNSMTPFQRNVWAIYNDKENVALIRSSILKGADPLTFTSSISSTKFPVKLAASYSVSYIRALRTAGSAEKLYSNSLVGYTQSEWQGFINQAKENGFFK